MHSFSARHNFSSANTIYVTSVKLSSLKSFIHDLARYDILAELVACFLSEDVETDMAILSSNFPFRVYHANVHTLDDISVVGNLLAFSPCDRVQRGSNQDDFIVEFLNAIRTFGFVELNVDFVRDLFYLKSPRDPSHITDEVSVRMSNFINEYRLFVDRFASRDINSFDSFVCRVCAKLYEYMYII